MLRALNALIRQLSLFDTGATRDAREAPEARPAAPEAGGRRKEPPREASRPAGSDRIPPPPDRPLPETADRSPLAASFASLGRGPFAHVRVEIGPRLRDSWKVSWTRSRDSLLLRIPAALEAAPWEAKEAVLRWAVLVAKRPRRPDAATRTERRKLEGIIRDALAKACETEPAGRTRALRLAANGRRLARLNPKGTWHDLEACLAAVNARYFGGALAARITWAVRLGGLSTHRLAEDGEGQPYHLITISRGYDSPEVTPEILGGVVYHECLHAVIPPRSEGGRRIVHGRDFRLREREYEHYRAWRDWHRSGLPKALRRLAREG